MINILQTRMNFEIEKYHLKSSSFFDYLSRDESAFVKKHLLRKEYRKGQLLFKENSYSKGIYIVRKGKVKIYQTNPEGKESIVYFYKKGDYFGYRPLLGNEPHPVSAAAVDNVVVSFIPRDIFLKVLLKSPRLAQKLLVSLSQEFSVWINKLTVFSQYSVRERVALSLLIIGRIYQREGTDRKHVVISLNRDDFAGFVGTAKETLVRMLRKFKDEEIISSKGTKIKILKPAVLVRMLTELP